MKILVALLLATPLIATAQTYKCTENGKNIYSDRPCSGSAVKLNIGDSAEETERLRQAAIKRDEAGAAMAAAVAKVQRESRRDASAQPPGRGTQVQNASHEDECASLLRIAKDAENEAELYATPRFRADAKRRQKEAEDAHFSRCYGTVKQR